MSMSHAPKSRIKETYWNLSTQWINREIWYKNLLEYKYLPDIKLADTTLYGLENDLVGLKLLR